MSQMQGPEIRIKVTKDGNEYVHELWIGGKNLGRVSHLWILETAKQFIDSQTFR